MRKVPSLEKQKLLKSKGIELTEEDLVSEAMMKRRKKLQAQEIPNYDYY